ncbi:MAG TPA: glycosyltransferase family 4 protein [Patescibacteria group bacterium]|nr:glycosyltransferase family 4 protein [Patescibacteria group bacterium]
MRDDQDLAIKLKQNQQPVKAIYIASYIPRRCGIATFTKDLTTAINNLNPYTLAEIVAVNDHGQNHPYPWEVKFRIGQHMLPDYSSAAHYINQSSAEVINLQHEFGLYGGVDGDYLLPLLDSIEKPLVTTFHTILPEPDDHKAYIMRRIIERSDAVVAMSQSSSQTLQDVYGCPSSKIALIYHGVPDFTFNDIERHKRHLRIKAQPMIMAAGLLGPGKGLEYVIDAMPDIVRAVPNAKLYIVGQTHPHIVRDSGEKYRESLVERVKKHHISRSVVFVNRYLDDDDLRRYYMAADFFVTAYPNLQQPASGTLAYALGAGKVCIATPYHYAREALSDDAGVLIEPRNSQAIADAVINTVKDPKRAMHLRKKAYSKARQMTWPNIGSSYLDLFRQVIHKRRVNEQADISALAN